VVSMSVEPPPPPPPPPAPAASVAGPAEDVLARYIDHYFGAGSDDKAAGQHTMFVRRAFTEVQKKQKRKYGWIIGALALLLACIGAYSFYLHQQASNRKAMAESLFYAMKSLDLDIANIRQLVTDSNSQQGIEEIRKYQDRRKEMEKSYDRFLTTLNIHERKMTPEERLVFRITRIFGECELDMPKDFVAEVEQYIQKWKQSGRLAKDLRAARENNYIAPIAGELLAAGLPPQFLYLALQESDFDPYISGPMTRKGIAKGMWQFIPETAVRYSLKIGPLADLRRPDPGDDRHHWDRETKAAVRYMKDLYGSDAQASGLLVMACYNWGEDYVLPLVRKLPPNPRDRNFWRLLSTYGEKIPQETHDYVFYIVSAAVIGENPRLFGFDFDNPLAQMESH
jgi:membrane-bound lytic murein transglycosylase D